MTGNGQVDRADNGHVDRGRTVERLAELDNLVADLGPPLGEAPGAQPEPGTDVEESDRCLVAGTNTIARQAIARATSVATETSDTLTRTYRYVRIVLIGTVPAMFLAIWLVYETLLKPKDVALPSISHYYYTPAGVVFIGGLVAAAAALLALSSNGVERVLLIVAAFFAPLIALVPTPVSGKDLANLDLITPNLDLTCPPKTPCIPAPFDVYVGISVVVWLAAVAVAIVAGFIIIRWGTKRKSGSGMPVSAWVAEGILVALWIAYFVWFRSENFAAAHVVSASTFFLIITAVVFVQARKPPYRTRKRAAAGKPASTGQKAIKRLMWIIASLMAVVLIPVVLLLLAAVLTSLGIDPDVLGIDTDAFAPTLVFWVEAAGLTLFGAFWVIQTVRKWNDPQA